MNEQSYYLIDDNIEFHFEPQDMKLKRGDKTIKLRPMEVKTLLCILKKTGQYMTRGQIANGIWQNVPSHDIQNKSAQATKYISIIRKQLAKIDIDESWLVTEEHLGYKVSCAVELVSVEAQQKQQQAKQKALGEAQKNHVRRDTRIKILVNTIVTVSLTLIMIGAYNLLLTEKNVLIKSIVQLTSLSGVSIQQNYSANGDALAFVHLTDGGRSRILLKTKADINYQPLGNGEHDQSPSFSPTSKKLAYHRRADGNCQIRVIEFNGDYHKIRNDKAVANCNPFNYYASIAWASDTVLYFTDRKAQSLPLAIYRVDLQTGQKNLYLEVDDKNYFGSGFYNITIDAKSGDMIVLDGEQYTKTNIYRVTVDKQKTLIKTIDDILLGIGIISDTLIFKDLDNQLKSIELSASTEKVSLVYPNPLKPIGNPVVNRDQNKLSFISGEYYKSQIHAYSIETGTSSEIIASNSQLKYPFSIGNEVMFISRESGIKQIYSYRDNTRYQLTNFNTDPKIVGFTASNDKKWVAISYKSGTSIYHRTNRGLTKLKHFPSLLFPSFKDNGERILLSRIKSSEVEHDKVEEYFLTNNSKAEAFEPTGIVINKAKYGVYHQSGIVYVPSKNDSVRLFTLESDTVIVNNISPLLPDGLALSQNYLFVATETHELLKIDLATGQVTKMPEHLFGQISVSNETIFYIAQKQGQMDIIDSDISFD
ncbi:MAG: hypothetical protein HRT35_16750 [Algicola sp.]|nr:hypothetical protein [Algicola sp.]